MKLVLDMDDTLCPAPIDSDLFPVAIISKYLNELGRLRNVPEHPIARRAYDEVIPVKQSGIYIWLAAHPRVSDARKTYHAMVKDGSLRSRNVLMDQEGVKPLFDKAIEDAPFTYFISDELCKRGRSIAPVLRKFDEVWVYTAASDLRAQNTITTMGLQSIIGANIITEADGLPKHDPESFRTAAQRIGAPSPEITFVDDNFPYVINAMTAGWNAFHSAEYADAGQERMCREKDSPCLKRLADLPRVVPKPI